MTCQRCQGLCETRVVIEEDGSFWQARCVNCGHRMLWPDRATSHGYSPVPEYQGVSIPS